MTGQERTLSEILTEMAESLFHNPRNVPSSEAAHVALFLAHAAGNECVGLTGGRKSYHNL